MQRIANCPRRTRFGAEILEQQAAFEQSTSTRREQFASGDHKRVLREVSDDRSESLLSHRSSTKCVRDEANSELCCFTQTARHRQPAEHAIDKASATRVSISLTLGVAMPSCAYFN